MIGTMVLVLMGCGSAVFAGSMAGNGRRCFGIWTFSSGDGVCYRRYFGMSHQSCYYVRSIPFGPYEWKRCGYVYAFPGYRSDYRFGYSLCPGDHRRARRTDGYRFHKQGTRQSERDRMKDRILDRYGLPLLRLSTTGTDEEAKIHTQLTKLLQR